MSKWNLIWDFFFGPKFKIGDLILVRSREPWEENLPIQILEVGHRSYRVSVQYRIGEKVRSHEKTIYFSDEWFYKKVNK